MIKSKPEISMIYNKKDNRYYIYDGEDFVHYTDEITEAYIVFSKLVEGKTRKELFREMGWSFTEFSTCSFNGKEIEIKEGK